MIKIRRKLFNTVAITEAIEKNFVVEPFDLCNEAVKLQIEIGNNSPKYSCILHDKNTNRVYGYALVRETNVRHPELSINDKDAVQFIITSKGFEITQLYTDKRLEIKHVLYLLNRIQDVCCEGNFNLPGRYVWCYHYGDLLFATTFQPNVFRGLEFNNLSRILYIPTIYGEEE